MTSLQQELEKCDRVVSEDETYLWAAIARLERTGKKMTEEQTDLFKFAVAALIDSSAARGYALAKRDVLNALPKGWTK
jgi:hypothetical protein